MELLSSCSIHSLNADFVVIGGGMAGICAALAAARKGARTVLIQDRSVLGGNASSEIKMHMVGADCHGSRPGARESGIIEEIRLEDAYRNAHRSYSQWDLLLYEKVKAEPNITLFLDTALVGCKLDASGKKIVSITALRNSTQDIFEVTGGMFADCSGDGRLGLEAKADYRMGRESREELGETLAMESPDAKTLGSSILITGRRYETPQPFHAPAWVRKFTKADLKHRPINSYEYGYWWFEWGGQLDTIKDNEVIRHELLRIALGIWDYVKNSGDQPNSANWALDWVGAIPGKRESRRLMGPHLLTEQDLMAGRLFEDAVAYGGWAIDIHPPEGVDVPDEPPFTPTYLPRLYTIPLRCLYSRNVSNLLFAGRNISASHVAFASTRVMATCSVMGQAIGTVAAMAVKEGKPLEAFSAGEPLHQLQQQLLRDDAFIPGVTNEDPSDLAQRNCVVTASSSKEGHEPALILDGTSRDLIGNFGTWADQKPHHWESASLPAWVELQFPEPIEATEIHLTFDSGFARELILSASDWVTKKTIRGAQPEVVKAYRIWAGDQCIVEETENTLRKRVHCLPMPVQTASLRLEVLATNGVPEARVFEMRVY